MYTGHAQRMRHDGVGMIPYDPYNKGSIESAINGCYAVFVNTVTDYNDPDGYENEKLQGKVI